MYDWVSLYHLTYLTLPLLFLALCHLGFFQLQGTPYSFFPRVSHKLYPQPRLTLLAHPHLHTLSTHQSSSKGYSSRENSLAQRPNQILFPFISLFKFLILIEVNPMREGAMYVLFTALSSMAKIVTVHASSSTNILNNGYYFNLKKYCVAIL